MLCSIISLEIATFINTRFFLIQVAKLNIYLQPGFQNHWPHPLFRIFHLGGKITFWFSFRSGIVVQSGPSLRFLFRLPGVGHHHHSDSPPRRVSLGGGGNGTFGGAGPMPADVFKYCNVPSDTEIMFLIHIFRGQYAMSPYVISTSNLGIVQWLMVKSSSG